MDKKLEKFLASIDLFTDLELEELFLLSDKSSCKLKIYKKDSVIYFQNQRCSTLDVILKGEILIQKIDSGGNVFTVSVFSAGDLLGGNLIFANNNVYPMTVLAKTQCTLLHIDKELVLVLCQKNQDFLVKFLQSISDKTLILTDRLKSVTLKTIRQCIIEFLTYEYYYQKTPNIKIGMTKKDLSERLGVQRPSLSRELAKMRDEGLIDFDSKHIYIKNFNIFNNVSSQ